MDVNLARAFNPTSLVRDTRQYLAEVQGEWRKITWSQQKEAVAGTIGVLVIVVIITTVLSIVDFVLGQLVRMVLP